MLSAVHFGDEQRCIDSPTGAKMTTTWCAPWNLAYNRPAEICLVQPNILNRVVQPSLLLLFC